MAALQPLTEILGRAPTFWLITFTLGSLLTALNASIAMISHLYTGKCHDAPAFIVAFALSCWILAPGIPILCTIALGPKNVNGADSLTGVMMVGVDWVIFLTAPIVYGLTYECVGRLRGAEWVFEDVAEAEAAAVLKAGNRNSRSVVVSKEEEMRLEGQGLRAMACKMTMPSTWVAGCVIVATTVWPVVVMGVFVHWYVF